MGLEGDKDERAQVVEWVGAIANHVDDLLVVEEFVFDFILLFFLFGLLSTFHLLLTILVLIYLDLLSLIFIKRLLFLSLLLTRNQVGCRFQLRYGL